MERDKFSEFVHENSETDIIEKFDYFLCFINSNSNFCLETFLRWH